MIESFISNEFLNSTCTDFRKQLINLHCYVGLNDIYTITRMFDHFMLQYKDQHKSRYLFGGISFDLYNIHCLEYPFIIFWEDVDILTNISGRFYISYLTVRKAPRHFLISFDDTAKYNRFIVKSKYTTTEYNQNTRTDIVNREFGNIYSIIAFIYDDYFDYFPPKFTITDRPLFVEFFNKTTLRYDCCTSHINIFKANPWSLNALCCHIIKSFYKDKAIKRHVLNLLPDKLKRVINNFNTTDIIFPQE